MNTKVVYYSKTKNTKKIAEAMAQKLGCTVQSIEAVDFKEKVDLLFLGCSMYKSDIDPSVRKFIAEVEPEKIGTVVLFSTGFTEDAIFIVKELLQKRNVEVSDKHFNCKGRFLFFNFKHPNKDDFENARNFADSVVKEFEA